MWLGHSSGCSFSLKSSNWIYYFSSFLSKHINKHIDECSYWRRRTSGHDGKRSFCMNVKISTKTKEPPFSFPSLNISTTPHYST